MNKTRVHNLEEKISKKNMVYVPPKTIRLKDGTYTDNKGKPLTEDKDGNFCYEDGAMYYKNEPLPDNQIGLIIRHYV